MKILQINTTVNSGSTGRITEDIGNVLISNGHNSLIAFGRGNRPSESQLFRIGNQWGVVKHALKTAIFDKHGFGSVKATHKLIEFIDKEKPDAIGLHNIHGYYINIEILFEYLRKSKIPVIWTLFDCWSFTGHCSYFDDISCEKWQTQCSNCAKTNKYPSSYLFDASRSNYKKKKELFNGISNLNIIVHSDWLKGLLSKSFLAEVPVVKIRSGIDIQRFLPQENPVEVIYKYGIAGSKIILGVASIWDLRKGFNDFIKLNDKTSSDSTVIVLVGLSHKQIQKLPKGIIGIARTESVQELAMLYSIADVFVNPTWQDNFPTTNLEALACGTPVITYNTGGSPEAIDVDTGFVVEKGDIDGLYSAVKTVLLNGKAHYAEKCRARAVANFNKDDRYMDYLRLYENIVEVHDRVML